MYTFVYKTKIMEDYIKKFAGEGSFTLSDNIAMEIIACSEEVRLAPKEFLVKYGSTDTNVYIVAEGILRVCYFDGNKEVTLGFTSEGTVLMSLFGYMRKNPAFMYIVSCGKSVVRKVSKEDFDRIVSDSHEFARWMYTVAIHQLYACEMKLSLISGTAQERYLALIRNRPDIIRNVSMKDIASYLGVTPSYLCKLKRRLLNK